MVYPSDTVGSMELSSWTHSELCFEIKGSSGHPDPWGRLQSGEIVSLEEYVGNTTTYTSDGRESSE
jgi:hypothetical protein